jgi:hypothetical protein
MYPSPTSSPPPDATVVSIGRRIAFSRTVVGAVLVIAGAGTVLGVADVAAHPNSVPEPEIALMGGSLLALLLGVVGVACMRSAWKRRSLAVSTDFAGLRLSEGGAHAVVPWSNVKAVGLHESEVRSHGWPSVAIRSWSLELHLRDPIASGDPLLDRLLLPADPPRYMIRLPRGARFDVMAAVRARVPELWLEAP